MKPIRSTHDHLVYAKELGIPSYHASDEWLRKTVIVFGNGPSVLSVDLDRVRASKAVSVICNSGIDFYPDANTLVCTDRHWLEANQDRLGDFKGPEIIVTRTEALRQADPRMLFMQRQTITRHEGDIFAYKGLLVEGYTSVSTAISLAVLRGSKKIALVGLDLKPGEDGRRRALGSDIDDPRRASRRYGVQIAHLTAQSPWVKKHNVRVYNCSPKSDLACYPYHDLEELL